MKILTATHVGQGVRDNDFDWTVEGELVCIQDPCGRDRADPDGGCGCGRSFAGLSSHRATTTAQIRDLALSRKDVATALAGHYESGGFGLFTLRELRDEVEELLDIAAAWDVGTIVERRLDLLGPRRRAWA